MAQIISLPFQGLGMEDNHQTVLADLDKTVTVFNSMSELIMELGENPEIIVMDFAWMDVYPNVLGDELRGRERFSDIPVIGVTYAGNIEQTYNQFNQYFNLCSLLHGGEQSPENLMVSKIDATMEGRELTEEERSCGLRDTVKKLIALQNQCPGKRIGRYELTGTGLKPKKQ